MKYNDLFSFDQEKAIEVIVYFAKNAPIADVYHLAKICYFADLLHLERYGRPICGDEYMKMRYGPVPINTYRAFNTLADFLPDISRKDNRVIASREPDLDLLSESDLECLDESIMCHGKKTFTQLKNESHDEAWESADDNRAIDYSAIIQMLPNAKQLTQYLNA